MDRAEQTAFMLPPDLMVEVEAIAALEHRSVREMVIQAIERFVRGSRETAASQPTETAGEVAARMLARRRLHPLPPGSTVRDLTTFGRA